MLGHAVKARDLVDQALQQLAPDAKDMSSIADIYLQLGDRDAAFTWLAKALQAGYPVAE